MRKFFSIAYEVAIWSCPVLCIAGLGAMMYGTSGTKVWAFQAGLWLYFTGLLLWLTAIGSRWLSSATHVVRIRDRKAFRSNPWQYVAPLLGFGVLLCFAFRLAWKLAKVAGVLQ
jgi:hypothetical protein